MTTGKGLTKTTHSQTSHKIPCEVLVHVASGRGQDEVEQEISLAEYIVPDNIRCDIRCRENGCLHCEERTEGIVTVT